MRGPSIARHEETKVDVIRMYCCYHRFGCQKYYTYSIRQTKKTAKNSARKHEMRCKFKPVEKAKEEKAEDKIDQIKRMIIYRWRSENETPTGQAIALTIHMTLEKLEPGRTWMDTKNLEPGLILRDVIADRIKSTPVVIVPLYAGCLDRCVHDDDFFRFELEQAIKYKPSEKRVVFLLFETTLPELLPQSLLKKNGFFKRLYARLQDVLLEHVSYDKNFDSVLVKLCNK